MPAQREALRQWAAARPQPWRGAMEATLFSGWIYDTLKPYGEQLEMAHPAKMKAISAGKKKSDTIDARTIADLVRCNLLPACYVAPPRIRELRRLLRYRSLVVSEAVRMKNKMAGLLMETGALYVKEKLHRKKYFASLLEELEEVPESVIDLLRLSRGALEMFESTQKRLVRELLADPELAQRVERLMTIPAVGEITALTWALEVGDPQRFRSGSDAMSYCGLTAALKSSAGKQQRGPISKQRNHWLQTTLIEAAKLAPRWNPQLAALHARELERGHRNRATLAVARKLVAYLLAVDKSRPDLSTAHAVGRANPKSCLRRKNFELSGDRPAVPRQLGDWAEESRLPMLLTVCIEAGRQTLTHTSWTGLRFGSRKWMSGQAAALAARNDRWLLANLTASPSLREPTLPSDRRPPSPLDFYLSWMSPYYLSPYYPVPVLPREGRGPPISSSFSFSMASSSCTATSSVW